MFTRPLTPTPRCAVVVNVPVRRELDWMTVCPIGHSLPGRQVPSVAHGPKRCQRVLASTPASESRPLIAARVHRR